MIFFSSLIPHPSSLFYSPFDLFELLADLFEARHDLAVLARLLGGRLAFDEEDAAGLYDTGLDLFEAVEALPVRHRQKLRLREQFFRQRVAVQPPVLDERRRRTFQY